MFENLRKDMCYHMSSSDGDPSTETDENEQDAVRIPSAQGDESHKAGHRLVLPAEYNH